MSTCEAVRSAGAFDLTCHDTPRNVRVMTNWYSNPDSFTAATVDGREVRIAKTIAAHDALLDNPTALRNAALTAFRMPFAFTANQGVVAADKIA